MLESISSDTRVRIVVVKKCPQHETSRILRSEIVLKMVFEEVSSAGRDKMIKYGGVNTETEKAGIIKLFSFNNNMLIHRLI